MTTADDTELTRNALPGILKLKPYSPGMPVEELQRRMGLDDVIKLASNENPLGASPRVRDFLANKMSTDLLAVYPDGSGHRLKQKLAAHHGIEPERITLGNGSNDLLEFLARIYAGPGRAVMFSDYAFAVYPLATLAQNAEAVTVPAFPADHEMPYGHDLKGFSRALASRPDVSLVFVANPNNPTGTWAAPADIEAFLEGVPPHVVVVLDEAYHDYQDEHLRPDARAWLERYPNLVVTRTFSKIHGLAGLRVGYGLSHPAIADLLNRVRQPFNNNSLALMAAEIAIDDEEHIAASVRVNSEQRVRLEAALKDMGLSWLPTQANFLTINFDRDAAPIHQGLMERGIIVRPMGSYALPNYLRLTIGSEAQNTRFLGALKDILAE